MVGPPLKMTQLRLCWDPLTIRVNSVLNVKAVVAAFNQKKALVGAFSVIVQLRSPINRLRHYTGDILLFILFSLPCLHQGWVL